jgi:hypothetical protein
MLRGRVNGQPSAWLKCSHPCSVLSATCARVPNAQDGTAPQPAESPAFAGLSHAPREIRTPTVQTDHKALNLARAVPDPSECRRSAHLNPGGWTIWTSWTGRLLSRCCHGIHGIAVAPRRKRARPLRLRRCSASGVTGSGVAAHRGLVRLLPFPLAERCSPERHARVVDARCALTQLPAPQTARRGHGRR